MLYTILAVVALCALYVAFVIHGFVAGRKLKVEQGNVISIPDRQLARNVAQAVSAGGVRPTMAVPRKRPSIRTRHTRTL